jgi:hypothetical protein
MSVRRSTTVSDRCSNERDVEYTFCVTSASNERAFQGFSTDVGPLGFGVGNFDLSWPKKENESARPCVLLGSD